MKNRTNEKLLGRDLFGEVAKPDIKGILKSKFLIPPFSVLSARDGDWQTRKRQWLQLGIQSEVGRGEAVIWGNAPSGQGTGDNSDKAYTDNAKEVLLRSGEGRGENLMGHGDTSGNIDFYAQKRKLEKETGKIYTTQEAKAILFEQGKLGAFSKESLGNNRGLAQSSGQDLMKGENPNFRQKVPLLDGGKSRKPENQIRLAENYGKNVEDMLDGSAGLYTSGTSIFDPVLCELMYSWFCPDNGQILDPFCGGSVRGVVASVMGYKYWGCDLRQEQIDANLAQIGLCGDNKPDWVVGDALDVVKEAPQSDFIFTCPPYGDLEVYSDNPKDISTMDFPKFITTLKEIIKLSCDKLKSNSFACIVVGDYRDKQGFYRCFPQHTIRAFLDAGLKLYNEIILVTAVGSLPIRITKQFEASRKIGKTHQNVLVFCKGTPPRFKGEV